MDALTTLTSRLEAIQSELFGMDKLRIDLQSEQKEIEAALRVFGRYSQEHNSIAPKDVMNRTEQKPSITLTDCVLQIVENAGATGVSTAEIKENSTLIYGLTAVKPQTLSVTLMRHKKNGRIKNVNKTWFLPSFAPAGASGEENSEVAASESYQL